jgi:hypothetical protein
VEEYTSVVEYDNTPTKESRRKKVGDKMTEFYDYYKPRRIYLPKGTQANIDAFAKQLGVTTMTFMFDVEHNRQRAVKNPEDDIRLETVDRFIPHSDFYTIDVADSIGKPASAADVEAFVGRHPELIGTISIPHIDQPFAITRAEVERVANKFLLAAQDAGKIYQHIVTAKGSLFLRLIYP